MTISLCLQVRSLGSVGGVSDWVVGNKFHWNSTSGIQLVCVVPPSPSLCLRDFFLEPANYASCRSPLVNRFGELLRKMWNTRNFKGQVSPHEFVQAVRNASKKRFTAETQVRPGKGSGQWGWGWDGGSSELKTEAGHREISTNAD